MKRIYKYPVDITDRQVISLPKGAKILSVQDQFGKPQLWALVDPEAELEERIFEVFGTGNPVKDLRTIHERIHITTFLTSGGSLVWHMFEVVDKDTQADKIVKLLEKVAADVEKDAVEFDGKSFDGKTVATYFGYHGAAIKAVADSLKAYITNSAS